MNQEPNTLALGLVIVGAFFSLGREMWAKFYVHLHARMKKQAFNERLLPGVQLYFMLTGMFFTIFGLLGFFGVLQF